MLEQNSMMLHENSQRIRHEQLKEVSIYLLFRQYIQFILISHSYIGGSLGWKTKGSLDSAFEAVAFELGTSTVNNPKIGEAKTGHG